MTASPPITSFSFSEKEKEGKRKTAQGTAPRSEPRFTPTDRDKIKSRGSMRLRPPRPPGERASRERQPTEILCTAEKVSVFGQKPFVSCPRGTISPLPSPQRGRLTVGFCFANRDFITASPGVYAILCSCKGTQAESAYAESAQESTLRGLRR